MADDLTGALDTGVQFRNWGFTVELFIDNFKHNHESDCEVVVIDTESRSLRPKDAYKRVYENTKSLVETGAKIIYKKVDSTLRGNVGAEIDAVIAGSDEKFSFFAPAYPNYNRTILDGKLIVDNMPIEETEYVNELPVKSSYIPEIVNSQTERRIGLINLEVVEAGIISIKARIKQLMKENMEVALFDTLTEKHLINIAKSSVGTKLFIGSAGFASEIPRGLDLRKSKPLISICGSIRKISRSQIKNLHDRLGFMEVELNTSKLLDGDGAIRKEVKQSIDKAVEYMEGGFDVSITSSIREVSAEDYIRRALVSGISEHEAKHILEEALGEVTLGILKKTEAIGLILIGGATSLMVCRKLGIEKISIVEEIGPGMPLLVIGDGLTAVTKAGGFGMEDSLVQVAQKLRRMKSI